MNLSATVTELNVRPEFDKEISKIADYVMDYMITSEEAFHTAGLCLMDSLGCCLLASRYPACQQLLGPIVPGATLAHGARVVGTDYELDPVQAAFNTGIMIRWLDYNDTWLAAEWGHPSDNLGGILACADYLSRQKLKALTMQDVLVALIKAYEIQGILALENSFNRVGLDHVVLVKVATAAVVTHLLGGDREKICAALSLAWLDGHSLRTYRHAPNTGIRKSWAAGDATARGLQLALLAMRGEKGYPSVLTAKKWGLYDVYFKGEPFKFQRDYGNYVIENILFKVYPSEFHGQTAVEAAFQLHPKVKDRLDDIERVAIRTQASAVRIINKRGQLYGPADRDHCLQYMTAVGLIYGDLTADSYEDSFAEDPRIDTLRNKIEVREDENFSHDYLDPDKRSIANAIQVFFRDGSSTDEVVIEYPLGHRRRRKEGLPVLEQKFKNNARACFDMKRTDEIFNLCRDYTTLTPLFVGDFVGKLWKV